MLGKKISKDKANYREATSARKRCGTCDMFMPKYSHCTLVRGLIYDKDTCDFWEKRK